MRLRYSVRAACASLLHIAILASLFLIKTPVFAADSTITISITPSPTINTLPNSFGSASQMITVSTNNYTGFNLLFTTLGSSTNLVNTSNSSKTIPTITLPPGSSSITAHDFDNEYGFSTDGINYQPVPTPNTSGILLKNTNGSGSNSTTLTFGVKVDGSIAAGTYQNTYSLIAVVNNPQYSINYETNTTDVVTGMPSNESITISNTGTATLPSNIPTRTDYDFLGWDTNSAATSASYSANGSIVLDPIQANAITLYAIWRKKDYLYDRVVDQWQQGGSRVQTNNTNSSTGIKAAITTTNSGVFKYDSTVFGTSDDAANTSDIYYYRGILDSNLDGTNNTYGSNGNGATWPNYVKLGNTCWRIIRTTGSGGVKMIYNGLFSGGTTTNSCANATTNAQVTTSAWDITANSNGRSIVGVGYTYNASYKSTTTTTTAGTLFGTNTNYSGNTTNSTIKNYIENTWYSGTNGISAYEDLLEPSAGYCNDRTVYNTSGTLIRDNGSITKPYTTSTSDNTRYNFGGRTRTITTTQTPTLSCPRNVVDLYTTMDASNGNKQLGRAVGLITADEASFAGSGSIDASNGSGYHSNSYLESGSLFWLLSPYVRHTNGQAEVFTLVHNTTVSDNSILNTYGIRPVISLVSGTIVASGNGTATDPWIINAP